MKVLRIVGELEFFEVVNISSVLARYVSRLSKSIDKVSLSSSDKNYLVISCKDGFGHPLDLGTLSLGP